MAPAPSRSGGFRHRPSALGPAWEVRNFGNSSKTMMRAPGRGHESYWDTPTFTASKGFLPHVVVIMLGTNDAKSANWRAGRNGFAGDCRAMIAGFTALPS